MSDKSIDLAVRELTKVVHSMQDRILSLEKLVIDQNKLIKQLASGRQDSSSVVKTIGITEEEGRSAPSTLQLAPRPVREAHVRASAALVAAGRKTRAGRNVSPLPARVETASAPAASRSAPPTPTASLPQPVVPPQVTLQVASMNGSATPTAMIHSQPESDDNTGEWTEINRRPRRAPTNVIRGTAAPGSTACTIVAAERKCYLHLYYVHIDTTAEQVLSHLNNICLGNKCVVVALKSRGDYASFKLTVPSKDVEKYLSPEHWAEDVHIKPWHSGFRKSQKAE